MEIVYVHVSQIRNYSGDINTGAIYQAFCRSYIFWQYKVGPLQQAFADCIYSGDIKLNPCNKLYIHKKLE